MWNWVRFTVLQYHEGNIETAEPWATLKTVTQVGTTEPERTDRRTDGLARTEVNNQVFNQIEPQLKFEICKLQNTTLASTAIPWTAQNFGTMPTSAYVYINLTALQAQLFYMIILNLEHII